MITSALQTFVNGIVTIELRPEVSEKPKQTKKNAV
jgi:hypothetical protein